MPVTFSSSGPADPAAASGRSGSGSTRLENRERAWQGEAPVSVAEHLGGAQFWFESFQNWQSEFLAIGSMVVLSIFLREKGSPESKALEAPHGATGS
ncbi:membrane protein [Opitutaceae bacterium TAV5]|nr:membrane protein [Opitutaceae bacterium TAV5]